MTMYFLGGMALDSVFVCGADLRLRYIADYFRAAGYKVYTFGLEERGERVENARVCDTVFLGLPALKDGFVSLDDGAISFNELLSYIKRGAYLFGGRLSKNDILLAQEHEIKAFDYSEDEIFQTQNALYTAEGALSTLIQNTDISICGMRILVVGGGRIAKAFCALTSGMPCKTDVYARSDVQRTFFSMRGHTVVSSLKDLSRYDAVVNTVPAHIFPIELLSTLKKDSVTLDLSQRPGYVPKDIFEKLGLKLLYLPGIPKKSAPRSAGIAAAQAAERMLEYTEAKNTEGI